MAPQTDLTAVVEDHGTTRTISLHGPMDAATAATVDDLLVSAVAEAGVETVVVDLAQLSLIDSAGIAVLLGLHAHCAGAGIHLVMLPARPGVQRTLAMCGVVERIPFAVLSAPAVPAAGAEGANHAAARGRASRSATR